MEGAEEETEKVSQDKDEEKKKGRERGDHKRETRDKREQATSDYISVNQLPRLRLKIDHNEDDMQATEDDNVDNDDIDDNYGDCYNDVADDYHLFISMTAIKHTMTMAIDDVAEDRSSTILQAE